MYFRFFLNGSHACFIRPVLTSFRLMRYLSVPIACLLSSICVAQTNTGNAFNGKTSASISICPESKNAFSDNDVIRLIDELTRISNLKNRFIVQSCPGIDNCQAVYYEGKPYILYNASFLSEVKRLSFSEKQLVTQDRNWEVLTILAHELAHHFNQHLNNPPPGATSQQLELEADEYAGSVLCQIGATLEQAQLAFKSVPDIATYTHPARADRLAAVERGWKDAKKRFPGTVPQEPVQPQVDPNVFTPNGDGKNDWFRIQIGGSLDYYKMTIFDRWGQQVFSSTNWQEGWDGKVAGTDAKAGSYFYTVRYRISGIINVQEKKGTVVLMR